MKTRPGSRTMMTSSRFVLCVSLLVSACAAVPTGEDATSAVVPVSMPQNWSTATATLAQAQAFDRDWWLQFKAPPLMELLKEAESSAPDLRIAMERIRLASIALKQSRAAELPTVNATANTTSRNNRAEGFSSTSNDNSNLGVSLSYELDLFGRLDAQTRAREADFSATRYDWQTARLALLTSVASTYFQWLQTDARIRLAVEQQAVAQRILAVAQARQRFGVATQIDVMQQQAVVLSQEIALGNLRFQQQQLASALALLLGRIPQGYAPALFEFTQVSVPVVPASLPSILLTRRPDLGSAEAALVAASANIDAARAALLPSLSLTGSYGLSSSILVGMADPVQSVGLGLSLMKVLFDGGQQDLQIQSQQTQRAILVETYAKAIRAALKEVEDGLGNVELTARQTVLQETQVDLAQRSLRLAELRYREGAGDFLTVLESQRALFSAQDQQLISQAARLQASIDLFKSLGGDWSTLPELDQSTR